MLSTVGKPLYGGTFAVEEGGAAPFVLPGEKIVPESSLTSPFPDLVDASPERVVPGCVHFGVCGGCQYQHAAYPAQQSIKQSILQDLLAPARLFLEPVLHSAAPWGYRNRIRLRLEVVNGTMQAGYNRRGSNDFLPITMCPIAMPLLWRTVQALLTLTQQNSNARRWLEASSEVELFGTPAEDRLQMQMFLRGAQPGKLEAAGFRQLCTDLHASIPQLAGAGATVHPDAPRRNRLAWNGVDWGADGLLYPVAGQNYWVSRGAFFQVNRFLIDTLVDLVAKGRKGTLAWDLYAGVGLFTRALADSFAQVVAVEGAPAAAADLTRLARAHPSLQAQEQPTLAFLQGALHQRERPELVVLDPPRAGLGVEGAELLERIGPAEIVYVSCDPVTLARDLAVLLGSGYSAQALHLIDLFPQTFHLETVVHLRRTNERMV